MSAGQFLIGVNFAKRVSLDEVLVGVTDWKEVDDQGDEVIVFLEWKRGQKPDTNSEESNEKKRILVTL